MKMKLLFSSLFYLLPSTVWGQVEESANSEPEQPLVQLEIWSSPKDDWDPDDGVSNGPNMRLFASAQQVHAALGPVVKLDVNQVLHGGCPSSDPAVCQANCVNGRNYCEVPPQDQLHARMSARNLFDETIRRMCIWNLGHGDPTLFLNYVFNVRQTKCDQQSFSGNCVNESYQLSKIDGNKINCKALAGGFESAQNTLFQESLARQKQEGLDTPDTVFPVVKINGNLWAIQDDQYALFNACCAAIPSDQKPSVCPPDTPPPQLETPQTPAPSPAPPTAQPESSPDLLAQAQDTFDIDAASAIGISYTPAVSKTTVDIWTTTLFDWNTDNQGDGPNRPLFQKLHKIQTDFGESILLRPRSYIYTMEEVCSLDDQGNPLDSVQQQDCAVFHCSNNRRYCAVGPNDWMVSGLTMVQETLRRLCIWQIAPRKFFPYWVQFHQNRCDNSQVQPNCIDQVLADVHIDSYTVTTCMDNSGGLLLDNENSLLRDLRNVQTATFDLLGLQVQDLPIVLIDGQRVDSSQTQTLYEILCSNLQSQQAPDSPDFCNGAVGEHIRQFEVPISEIQNRENQFEHDMAQYANVPEPDRANPALQPIVEVWTTPILDWKSGLDSGDGPNIGLFEKMRELVIAMDDRILFRPQYYLYDRHQICDADPVTGRQWPPERRTACQERDCSNLGSYCDPGTDNPDITGADLIAEGLRRICVWYAFGRKEKEQRTARENVLFFDYLADFHSEKCHGSRDKAKCVEDIMARQNITKDSIDRCIQGSGGSANNIPQNALLQDMQMVQYAKFYYHQLDPVNLPIVLINGQPLEEGGTDLSLDELIARVCLEFPEEQGNQPNVCTGNLEETLGENDLNATVSPVIMEELKEDLEAANIGQATYAPTEGDTLDEGGASDPPIMEAPGNKTVAPAEPTTEGGEQDAGGVIPITGEVQLQNKTAPTSATYSSPTEVPVRPAPAGEVLRQNKTAPTSATYSSPTEVPVKPAGAGEVLLQNKTAPTSATYSSPTEVPVKPAGAGEVLLQNKTAPTSVTYSSPTEVPGKPAGAGEVLLQNKTAPASVTYSSPTEVPGKPANTNSVSPLAATTYPLATEVVATKSAKESKAPLGTWGAVPQTEAPVVVETASPIAAGGVNSTGDPSSIAPQRTPGEMASAATGRPAETQIQTGTLDIEVPPLGEVENLEDLDLTLVTSAIDHMEALQKCDVDTKELIKKLMSLAAGGNVLKQEAASIETDLPFFMSENCPHEEGEEILRRMKKFNECSLFNLQELIETFPSTAMGVAMRCTNAYSKMTPAEESAGFVPEACLRTIEAGGVLGQALFGLYLYPDVMCPCFEKLGKNMPECTADVWPIPINGVLVRTQSCVVGEYCQVVDGLCDDNLEILNRCLPSEDVKAKDIACGEVFDACADIYENVPPMLNAAPLPDACVRVAEGSKFYGQHVVNRYDNFRHQCGKNLELWEGHTPVAEFKAFVTNGMAGIDLDGFDFLSGISGGFLLGIGFAVVFVIVRSFCIWINNLFRRCCGRQTVARPRTKDYATVDTTVDSTIEDTLEDNTEYKD